MPILHGVCASPYVRKVKVVLAEKRIACDLNHLMPPEAREKHTDKSPLGKIPFFEDGDFVLPDSSCIVAYLERKHPEPPIYPADPEEYGRALWYEEYADTRLWDEALHAPFMQRIVMPMYGEETDEDEVQRTLAEGVPGIFDYLEGQVHGREYLAGDRFSIADIAVVSPFVNFFHAGEAIDTSRWPDLATYVERIQSRDSFQACLNEDQALFSSASS